MVKPPLPTRKTTNDSTSKDMVIALSCLFFGGALLGLSTNIAKYAGSIGLAPLTLIFWSIFGAALILLIISYKRNDLPPITPQALHYYFIAALVSVAGSNLIFFSATPKVGASFVALTITLPPLLTYLGALLLRLERFDMLRASGVVAALSGAGVLALRKLSAPDASVTWILITLCGPILLAIGNLYRTTHWPQGGSPSALAPGMLLAAALQLGVVGLLPNFSLALPSQDPQFLAMSIAVIVLQTLIFAIQFQVLFVLQKTGGPVLLSLLGSVAAVVAVPVSIIFQGETLPDGLLLGGSLIALGVALVSYAGFKNQVLKR